MPLTSTLASQVWLMNKVARPKSAVIIARPADRRPPVDSSAIVALPSKPRKLSTAVVYFA